MYGDSELDESEFDAKYFSKKENAKFKDILRYLRNLEMHACKESRTRQETMDVFENLLSEQTNRCPVEQLLNQETRNDLYRK
jgi:hypothetical protein